MLPINNDAGYTKLLKTDVCNISADSLKRTKTESKTPQILLKNMRESAL